MLGNRRVTRKPLLDTEAVFDTMGETGRRLGHNAAEAKLNAHNKDREN
jgi:hypothetical protein